MRAFLTEMVQRRMTTVAALTEEALRPQGTPQHAPTSGRRAALATIEKAYLERQRGFTAVTAE